MPRPGNAPGTQVWKTRMYLSTPTGLKWHGRRESNSHKALLESAALPIYHIRKITRLLLHRPLNCAWPAEAGYEMAWMERIELS